MSGAEWAGKLMTSPCAIVFRLIRKSLKQAPLLQGSFTHFGLDIVLKTQLLTTVCLSLYLIVEGISHSMKKRL